MSFVQGDSGRRLGVACFWFAQKPKVFGTQNL